MRMVKSGQGFLSLAWMPAIFAFLAAPAPSFATWTADAKGLSYSTPDKKPGSAFKFESRPYPDFLSVTGGVCGRGEFAWLDHRGTGGHSFKFFGGNGQVLWEKNGVVGATIGKNCDAVVLMEVSPDLIARNEHGNAPWSPRVYDRQGKLILNLEECKQFSELAQFEERFGSVTCWPENPKEARFILMFDVQTRRKKQIAGDAGIRINPDGTYVLFTERQSFDPKTKKYGAFVRYEYAKGSFD